MGNKDLPDISRRMAEEREESALTERISADETPEEADLRHQFRMRMRGTKAREYLAKGVQVVTDDVITDGEERVIKVVDRNRATMGKKRPDEDAEEIAKYLKVSQKLRKSSMYQVGVVTAEETSANALRPFKAYVKPPETPAPVSPPAKKKMIVVTKGSLLRPDKVEEFEV